jgi:hypothetical protein
MFGRRTVHRRLSATLLCVASAGLVAAGPAEKFDIHVVAPHVVDGVVMGPFHHYCKLAQADPLILECLLYTSSDANARMVGVEYMIDKRLTRANLPLETWNAHYHDHEVEIASGRVQVLDRPEAEAKALAEAAARTDGVIWKLWMDEVVPSGKARLGQAVGHKPRAR